jgi:predicted MPP superfamily phosphohydrolase
MKCFDLQRKGKITMTIENKRSFHIFVFIASYYSKYIISIHDKKKKQTNDMKLVHLSDLHIGGAYFNQDIFDSIVYEDSNKLKPDAVLITRDPMMMD